MNPGMVVCSNGEPDPMGYRYIGPFDGPDHARLWEQTLHTQAGKPCPYQHWIETLERPSLPRSIIQEGEQVAQPAEHTGDH